MWGGVEDATVGGVRCCELVAMTHHVCRYQRFFQNCGHLQCDCGNSSNPDLSISHCTIIFSIPCTTIFSSTTFDFSSSSPASSIGWVPLHKRLWRLLLPWMPRRQWHVLPLFRGLILFRLLGPPAIQLPLLSFGFLLPAGRRSAISPVEHICSHHRVRCGRPRHSVLHLHPHQAPQSRGCQALDSAGDGFRTDCMAIVVVPSSGFGPFANTRILAEPVLARRTSSICTPSRRRRDTNSQALRSCCSCCCRQTARCSCCSFCASSRHLRYTSSQALYSCCCRQSSRCSSRRFRRRTCGV
jgi:hypothetical protein